MNAGEAPQLFLAFRRKPDSHLPPVFIATNAFDEPPLRQPVDQADGAVMANQQMRCNLSDRRAM